MRKGDHKISTNMCEEDDEKTKTSTPTPTPTDLDGRTCEASNKIRSCGGRIKYRNIGGVSSSTCIGGASGNTGTSATSLLPDQVLEIVLENILIFLESRHDRNSASLVCKSWYRAEALTRSEIFIGNCYAISPHRVFQRFRNVRSLYLKGKPRFADFDLVPLAWGAYVKPWIHEMSLACPGLERICLKRMMITDEDLNLVSHAFPLFKELVLISCEGFGLTGISYVAENCRYLRVLDLLDCEVDNDNVDCISHFPETSTCLESLIFDCVISPINFDALEQLVARSPSLRKLRLNGHVSVAELCRLMLRAPQLTHLGTGSFNINAVFADPPVVPPEEVSQQNLASAFAACKYLTCLSGLQDIVPDYLPAIYPVCADLISLNFSYVNINTEQLRSVICHCNKLQVLWVLDSITDEGLQAVAESCKDLRELRVFPVDVGDENECPVSEIGLLAISEGCRKLQSILYFCRRMTNAAVIAMSRNCPDLVVFRLCIMGLHQPDHLTNEPMDQGFGAIVMNCKKLTRLAISGLLTDKAFKYIGEYGKLVRTLSVAFAGDSDMALTYVLKGCPQLQKLEIRDSPFGDDALLSGLHHYYKMRFLWMSSCKLTLGGCKELARALPHLVVEVISDEGQSSESPDILKRKEEDLSRPVEKLYLYRSLEAPRNDAPKYVAIL